MKKNIILLTILLLMGSFVFANGNTENEDGSNGGTYLMGTGSATGNY